MRRAAPRQALLVAGFAAVVPALTALVVVLGLEPASRQSLLDAAREVWWALLLGLVVLVGGVWWLMRGRLRAHDESARRLAASARTAATANPRHRASDDGVSLGHTEVSEAINALATRVEEAHRTVEERVAQARAEAAAERDRLAAVLADLDHPVLVCTRDGLVLLLNDAARHACGQGGYVGVGRSVFSLLDRDDLAEPVSLALRGGRSTAAVRCGEQRIDFQVGPVTEAGRYSGFVLVGPAEVGAQRRAQDEPDAASAAAKDVRPVVARAAARPVVYDFSLLELDAGAAGSDEDLRSLAFTVLDTETTGLDPRGGDAIVSVGAVRVDRGRVREDDVFDRLVDPRRPIPAAATAVHGITDEMVAGRSTLPTVLADLARFSEQTVLVGHDLAFDLAFLRPAEAATDVVLPHRVLDILLLSAVLHPAEGEPHSLEALAQRYDVPVLGRHTALGDALVTAEILVRMVDQLRTQGIQTYGDAVAAASTTPLAKESAERF